ncbi:HAD-IIA family hydrolase [Roseibium sediminicola]|uniref:HAD hydrolase-like protein n=1 Tax=Roseibium sediminicola TaxID=2933272 RepID=A0ABT0GX54_9HYPH|nr:HAD family hydrolase [Roseibium sp. CAU 1639]MCK7614028.1 HAD hydrolase-like protein [Roseibium sp. CAU 1639]
MPKQIVLSGLDAKPVQRYRAVLCDLDGCLIAGGVTLPGAVDFVHAVAERLWIVSNNSSDTAKTLAAQLHALGLPVPESHILLAGEQAVDHLAGTNPGAHLRCLANEPIVTRAKESGLRLGTGRADYVLLGRMAAFDLEHLQQAVADLHGGARLLVANADRTHPGPSGVPVPETGAWLAAVKACLPELDHECFGKPSPRLLRQALERAGVATTEAVFVGDNPETDGAAAAALELDFIEIRRIPAMNGSGALNGEGAGEALTC